MLTQTQIKGTGSKQTIFPLKHFQVDWCAQNQNEEKNWRAQKLRGSALKKLKPKGELHVKSPFTIMQQFDAFITLKIVTLLNCLVYSNELSFVYGIDYDWKYVYKNIIMNLSCYACAKIRERWFCHEKKTISVW